MPRPPANFQNPNSNLAGSPTAPNLKIERADWTLFRTIDGLTQKAGVSRNLLTRLVLKELADTPRCRCHGPCRRAAQEAARLLRR